jgi:hypothetical protein
MVLSVPVRGEDIEIANGASMSDSIRISDAKYLGLITPSAWTPADVAFQASHDGVNFYPLYDDAGERVREPVGVSRAIALTLNADTVKMWDFIKLESVSSADGSTPVNQGASRIFTIVLKG